MGPLFQLLFFAILYSVASLAIGAMLALCLSVFASIIKTDKIKAAAWQGFCYPFKLIPYWFLAIIATVFICEGIRNVDAPFTDYWTIPISDTVQLIAIDTTDRWHLSPVGGGEGLSGDIASFAVSDEIAYGVTTSNNPFIFDIQSSHYRHITSVDEFNDKLSQYGINTVNLLSPNDYYTEMRSTGDLVLFLLLLIYPAYRLYTLFKRTKLSASSSGE